MPSTSSKSFSVSWQDSESLLKSVLKSARRKSASQAGVQKSASVSRRKSVGGVIGNKVVIPGSPATTLPELLREAEASIRLEEDSFHASLSLTSSLPPKTPGANTSLSSVGASGRSIQQTVRKLLGPRDWTKADWKLMDSCFTDERLTHTQSPQALAPAEDMDLEKVVDRFVAAIGGMYVLKTLGPSWTRYVVSVRLDSCILKLVSLATIC